MAFVITNDPSVQLVTGSLEDPTVNNISEITGSMVSVSQLTGTIEAVCGASAGFQIDTFVTAVATQESGASVATPAFTATYSIAPDAAVLTDNDGSPSKDVISNPYSFSSDGTFQKTNATVTFTLTADRGAVQDTAVESIAWQSRTFYGIGTAALLNEAQIEALTNQLDGNYNAVLGFNAPGASDYAWYCFPQSYDPTDAAQFQVGPFVGGFQKVGVVSVTNANAVTQDYACWRSDFPALGSITVTVF